MFDIHIMLPLESRQAIARTGLSGLMRMALERRALTKSHGFRQTKDVDLEA